MVIETNTKRKNNNDLFDKLWYVRREESIKQKKSDGFVFDQQGLIANSAVYQQVKEEQAKSWVGEANIKTKQQRELENVNLKTRGNGGRLSVMN